MRLLRLGAYGSTLLMIENIRIASDCLRSYDSLMNLHKPIGLVTIRGFVFETS